MQNRPDSKARLQSAFAPLIPLLILLTTTAVLLLVFFHTPSSWTLDIGSAGDERYIHNFFPPDMADSTSFRWSNPGSQMVVYGATPAPSILSLRMHSRVEGFSGGRPLQLSSNTHPVATVDVADTGWRVYRVLLPEGTLTGIGGAATPLELTGPARFHETRMLGMAIDRATLAPLPTVSSMVLVVQVTQALLLTWLLAGLAGVVWALDEMLWPNARRWASALRVCGVVAAAALLLLWQIWEDPHGVAWVLPSPLWGVVIGAVALSVPFWARWLSEEQEEPRNRFYRPSATVTRHTYVGLFLVALATLMYENLLTRIFSVTMWYHFAFIAISVAMFGMTVGAILVYLFPRFFTTERAPRHLALSALLFAITIVVSFLTHLSIPFITEKRVLDTLVGVYAIALTYVVISLPFVLSGICVTLALTRFPRRVSTLYAADLAGAAIGCLLVIATLSITDGPTAVLVVACLASVGAIFFAWKTGSKKLIASAAATGVFLASFAVYNTALAQQQAAPLRLVWVKGDIQADYLYEKWNSFSRIVITGDMNQPINPLGWGMSPTFPDDQTFRQLWLTIDSSAGTALTAFHGDMNDIAFLTYDVTNVVHAIQHEADVLVVGIGGGRDILSALAFDQQSVTGVEINGNIINAVTGEFGNFTGYLDKDPRVTFVNDEARSYIARQQKQYDIIQVSLIDTWAATTSGAFVLTENSLYTTEAWELFLDRLTPGGVLSFSRWYFRDEPGEMYRVTSLATAALKHSGVQDPRNHIVIVRSMKEKSGEPDGIGTILVSKEPFSAEKLNALDAVCARLQFDVVLSPRTALDPTFATIASGTNFEEFTASFPINIAPPTDDSPFFFHMLRLSNIFSPSLQEREDGAMAFNMQAVRMLGILLLIVTVLTLLCIIVPLAATAEKTALKGSFPLLIFFGSIGFGFMLVEISQLQRLIVFLGHPTYSLSVVLFTLLLSSGVGSSLTEKVGSDRLVKAGIIRFLLLLGALLVFGFLTPSIIHQFQSATTAVRILLAVGILSPLGLFMGMAFPLGMKMAASKSVELTPWLWGINGATSVCASVMTVVIALTTSISTSFWVGVACYVGACLSFAWAGWWHQHEPQEQAGRRWSSARPQKLQR